MTRRVPLAALTAAFALVAAGCASQASPSWSFAPASSSSAGPSAASAPAGTASAAPVVSAAPAVSAAPGPSSTAPLTGGATVDLTAKNITFDKSSVTAPANVPFTIHFDNEDAGIAHDVAIMRGSATGQQVFKGQIVTGVASIDYAVPALPPGTYTLICEVHPTQMVATLTVK